MCSRLWSASRQAVGGFAGPRSIELDGGSDIYDVIIIGEDAEGTLELLGKFERNDEEALPASTALLIYLDDEDALSDFVRGRGEIDPATGEFTAIVTDIPNAFTRLILSFVVRYPADASRSQGADTVFPLYVANNGCGIPLSITLEWDTNYSYLDLYINDPAGNELSPGSRGVSMWRATLA